MKYLFLILFSFVFFSCELFTTRNAEEPVQPRSNFQPAVEPSILIQNLIYSFADKNVENYLACLTDSTHSEKAFSFSPSGGASAQFPELADKWGIKNEEQYFNNVKVRVPVDIPITLSFSGSQENPLGDSLIFTSSYSINIPHNDSDIPMNYQGELRFHLIRDNTSIWRIYFWQDIKSSDVPSWSELKGRFY
jgi:hypothetical protein